ncbi:MAG TPA: cyclase family protein [Gemmataceae bacterium]|jgi:arylformamidase
MNRAKRVCDYYDTFKSSLFSLFYHDLWGHPAKIMIYDITPAVSPRLQVWPGDTPPTRELLCDMHRGDQITLSTLHATVHMGAHADAPSHYGLDAPTIDECSLEPYLGPCQVLHVNVPRRTCISPDLLPVAIQTTRLLLATGTYPDPESFNTDFAALAPELVQHLHRQGVKLIGIDTPGVDLFDSKDLPSHRQCLKHDIAILEGLLLKHVPEGTYELIALPLKLVDFDGSPVRAILRAL